MDMKNQPPVITYDELEQRTRELVMPIDFDGLIQAGVLEEHRGWYKILKADELPVHAKAKIHIARTSEKRTLVKFRAPSKRLAKVLGNRRNK